MGIEIGQAHWSYSGFMRFRKRLLREEDDIWDLARMEGYGGRVPWAEIRTDLKPLLDHSDCEGELTPTECAQTIRRLVEILHEWGSDPYDYDVEQGWLLAEAMQESVATGEPLEFR